MVITETNYKKYYSLQAAAANKRAGKLQSGKLEFIVQNFMIFKQISKYIYKGPDSVL